MQTAINSYDSTTVSTIRDRVTSVEQNINGISQQVLDVQTSADPETGEITYTSNRLSTLEQEADKISLMVSVDGTTSSLTLTQNMLTAMTSQFVVKDPNGSATIISGGRIQANAITTAMLDTDAIKSSNYNSGTSGSDIPAYDATDNPYHYSTAGTFLDLSNGNFYSPNFSLINAVPTGSSVNVGAYLNGTVFANAGKIGNINISPTSVYSGTRNAYDSENSGFYLGADGKVSFGTNGNYIIYDGQDITIKTDSFLFGDGVSINESIDDAINTLNDSINTLSSTVEENINNTDKANEWIDNNAQLIESSEETIANMQQNIETIENDVNDYKILRDLYLQFDTDPSSQNAGLTIGSKGENALKTRITNNRFSFLRDDEEVVYISENEFNINNGVIRNTLRIGNFVFAPDEDGSLGLRYAPIVTTNTEEESTGGE